MKLYATHGGTMLNKYGALMETELQKLFERIENLENHVEKLSERKYKHSFEQIKGLIDLSYFEGKYLTFKRVPGSTTKVYGVYTLADVHIGEIEYMPIYNEYRFFANYDAEITLSYDMLLDLTGFIYKLNREKK